MDPQLLLSELRARFNGVKFRCLESVGGFLLEVSAQFTNSGTTLKIRIPRGYPKSGPVVFLRSSNLQTTECQKLEDSILAKGSLDLEPFVFQAVEIVSKAGPQLKTAGSKPSKKPAQVVADNGSSRKPSMRTADDVIKRFQWDRQLNKDEVIVGYLDRFRGVVEKPFDELSWEKEALTDTDPSILAIPQHRIQYFKYKDEIVWEKAKRIDKIFGSTGATATIDLTPSDQEESSSEESHEDEIQTAEPAPAFGLRPNYFTAIPVTNESIKKRVLEAQEIMVSTEPSLSAWMTPINSLHITLCTLLFRDDTEIASEPLRVFTEVMPELLSFSNMKLFLRGIDTFGNRVIFVKIDENGLFNDLANQFRTKFGTFVNRKDLKRPFLAHMTIAKLPFSAGVEEHRKMASAFTRLSSFLTSEFGYQEAESVYCCRAKKDDNNLELPFGYPIAHTLPLR